MTPGYQGTRQRVPRELGSPRDTSRSAQGMLEGVVAGLVLCAGGRFVWSRVALTTRFHQPAAQPPVGAVLVARGWWLAHSDKVIIPFIANIPLISFIAPPPRKV